MAVFPASVQAQSYAEGKTITFIVPYAAGGTSDIGARMLADALEGELKATVQVVNKPGAASQVGLTELINSKPDGLTIAVGVLPTLLTHYLDPNNTPPYTRENFTPIAKHFHVANLLAVQSGSPYQSIVDLVAARRRRQPSRSAIASARRPHLLVLLLEQAADVRFASVHFQGGAPATTAILGGHVDVLSNAISDVLPYVKTGEFRVLGLADEEPSPLLPGVETFKAQGFDVVGVSSTAVLAPAGLPADIAEQLTSAIERVMANGDYIAKLNELGVTPDFQNAADLTQTWIGYEEKIGPALESMSE